VRDEPNQEQASNTRPANALDLSALYARLREGGQRLTPQRLLILELLHTHGAGGLHVTADELLIAAQLRYPYLNVSTVYRYLELLRDIGIVTETDLGDGRRHFSLLLDERHHHLVCLQCGYVQDAEDALFSALRDNLLARHGFDARIDHMAVFGLCEMCRAASPAGG
jgi:Fur family transcriptional regulator, ferric uptake regulator